jgi:hypothetical protein
MGILGQKKAKPLTTKDFYFGAPEAEGEIRNQYSLTDYFEDYLDVLGELEKGKFLFVGRKGVGKSAIAKYIKDVSDKTDDSHAVVLRISDLNRENKIQALNNGNDIDMPSLFEWLILVNTVKLIVSNKCGTYTKEYDKLKKFLERNTGSVDIDKFQIDEILIKKGGTINFDVLKHAFGGVFKRYFDSKTSQAPYFKLIAPLKEILKTILNYDVNREVEFWLLFDDLDINYDINSESDNMKIIDLLRIAKEYNNDIFKNNTAKILIFIRKEIRDFIISKYSDSAKIFNSYEIVINWYDHILEDENEYPLKKLANKRIEVNFQNHNIKYEADAWSSLIQDTSIENKTSFKYVLDFTFYRPRDIVTFLNKISAHDYSYPINSTVLKEAIKEYIEANIVELKSELSLFFSDEEKNSLFNVVFPYIIENNSNANYDSVKNKIESLNFKLESEKVINILLGYSLLVYRNYMGELYFNYREENVNSRQGELFICLHKCLYHYYKPIR